MTTVKNDYGNNDYDNIDYYQLWLLLKWLLTCMKTKHNTMYDYLIEILIAFAYCKSLIPRSCFSWSILE
jgi:hypothetical protein